MDCSPSGRCVHGILQARNTGVGSHFLLWGFSQFRDQILVSCIAGWIFTNEPALDYIWLYYCVVIDSYNGSNQFSLFFFPAVLGLNQPRERLLPYTDLSVRHGDFPVVACGLSCSESCGILVPQSRDWTHVPCIASWIPNHWTTRKVCPFCFNERENTNLRSYIQDSPFSLSHCS